jgi:hypothetical protein
MNIDIKSIDFIFCINVIHHFDGPDKFIVGDQFETINHLPIKNREYNQSR